MGEHFGWGRGKKVFFWGGGTSKFFVYKISLKNPKKFPPAAGGQGRILRREFVLLQSLVTFWEQNFFLGKIIFKYFSKKKRFVTKK